MDDANSEAPRTKSCLAFILPSRQFVKNLNRARRSSARTLVEYVLRHRHCREHVGPPDIESEMSDRLRDLGLCQAIVHPDIQVTGQLSDLPGRNQRADRDEAAIARRKAGAEPQVTEQNIRVYCTTPGKIAPNCSPTRWLGPLQLLR